MVISNIIFKNKENEIYRYQIQTGGNNNFDKYKLKYNLY